MIEPAVAGVIGWPIAHSKSPRIHRFWLEKLGMDGDYSRFPVAPERLGDFMKALPAMGLRGVNVTLPHKVAMLGLVDVVDERARHVGAINTVHVGPEDRLIGSNTDVDGIIGPCHGHDIAGAEVVILGSGGAARAAMVAAGMMGAANVTVIARNIDAGTALLRAAGQPGRVRPWGAPAAPMPGVRLIFNATSLGMTGQPALDFDPALLPDGCLVFDAVYAPLQTPLLMASRARGLPVIDGLAMLIGQAAKAFEIFYRAAPPRQHDAQLRDLLTA